MSETVLLRPTSFRMELHVDPPPEEDIENDLPLTTRSWRVQLLRLLQRAPVPVPVFCDEPRSFPHFESGGSRISESSWTSNSTRSTDFTTSDSSSLVNTKTTSTNNTNTKKGANEDYQNNAVVSRNDSSLKPAVVVLSTTDTTKDAVDGSSLPTIVKEGIEIYPNGKSANRKDEVEKKLSNCPSVPQENSNSKVRDNRKHQLQTDEEESKRSRGASRNTLSLSIQGDSEYWEKFRHSKDYQSSLMIETICNEVFNLKPSPRYKSLMKLSETGSGNIRRKSKREMESPIQLPVVEYNDDNDDDDDEKRIKVEMLETEKEPGTKSSLAAAPSPLKTQDGKRREKDMTGVERKVENAKSFPKEQRQQKDNDTIEDNDDGNDEKKETLQERQQQQQYEESKIRVSITSSVFTTTTATTEGAEEENDRRRNERVLLLKSFGQAFHGYLTKRETEKLLRNEGQYLIRQMWNEDGFIVSFMFDNSIRNYRLLCDVGMLEECNGELDTFADFPENDIKYFTYYLEDRRKCYHSVDELVREGLITLHLDENAGSYVDLLVELAQFQRNDNLLQTPPAVTPVSRKNSRSASFRMARLARSSSAFGSVRMSGGGGSGGGNSVDGDNSSSITDGRISMDIALLIHYFEEEIFDGLAKCQVCTNGIWGPTSKGLRCRDCNLSVHESCTDNVKTECSPDLMVLSPFSTDLTSLVKGSRGSSGTNGLYNPPYILTACINEVETRGITTEGLYRICGSVEEIEKLKNLFEKEKVNTTLSSEYSDIHSITSLIKFFLRQLPDPLITQEAFEEFTRENDSGENTAIDAAQILVRCLPPAHRLTLKYLLGHLQRVAKEKDSNKMNAFNLSSIFMPSLLRPENMFDALESGTKLLHLLITHTDQVFKL